MICQRKPGPHCDQTLVNLGQQCRCNLGKSVVTLTKSNGHSKPYKSMKATGGPYSHLFLHRRTILNTKSKVTECNACRIRRSSVSKSDICTPKHPQRTLPTEVLRCYNNIPLLSHLLLRKNNLYSHDHKKLLVRRT